MRGRASCLSVRYGVAALAIDRRRSDSRHRPLTLLRFAQSTSPRARGEVNQIRPGNLMMKLSRFGILTLGSVWAFIGSSSGMILLPASR